MLKKDDIEHLGTLARIAVSEEEKERFARDLDHVLTYVGEISEVATGEVKPEAGLLKNVMREDSKPRTGGEYTEAILANAPHRDGQYVRVKRVM